MSPMLSKSFKSLDDLGLTFLLDMYLIMKLSDCLIFFKSEAICLTEP